MFYSDILKKTIDDEDCHYNILKYIPAFFSILKNIYLEKEICGEIKVEINCALSYFVLEQDYIRDDLKEKGYLDDLYMCAYVLNDIKEEYPDLIEKYWKSEENFSKIIIFIMSEIEQLLGEDTSEILAHTGMLQFKHICENEGYLYDEDSKERNIQKIMLKIGDLKILFNHLIGNRATLNLTLNDYRQEFNDEEWKQVVNILEKIKIDEMRFDNVQERITEEQMKKIKEEVLLSIDETIFEED